MRKWLRGNEKAEKSQCEVGHTGFGATESWRGECDGDLAGALDPLHRSFIQVRPGWDPRHAVNIDCTPVVCRPNEEMQLLNERRRYERVEKRLEKAQAFIRYLEQEEIAERELFGLVDEEPIAPALTCLYEVLLHADDEQAVSYAQAAYVAASLINKSAEELDSVRIGPLIDALAPPSDRVEEPRVLYVT
jgi:hypothetical protein